MEERKLSWYDQSSNFANLLQNQRMYTGAHFPVSATNQVESAASWSGTMRRPLFKPVELDDNIGRDDDDSDDSSLRLHNESKRRLTADQVRFLENSFELDNKLEPQRKARLAKALRLKPRQIAIWFQNRRARWKTKQLEKDYEALRSIYETLKVDRDCLIKEKEDLETEVLSLTKKLLLKERASNSSATILDSEISTPCVDEEGYNSMLMELTGSSNAFGLDDIDNYNSDHRSSQIGEVDDHAGGYDLSLEDDSCGYGLLWS
ncbi:homeobox-leucine zipper protein HAT5-like [Zingiber officinale]|uniref:Homeobox-leucine zipper protein n=1 Tax=Zingiber officinale TaxID=94328 RepID=A0A8J5G5I8_ZINOF|nr:homeobox-leucine zipper protein HAT5-like [Zingiber officinale]KAG6498787.1 hypothetical protein ZIOFF_038509 [Zingiber officinale]